MRKTISLFLALVIVLSIAGCGSSQGNADGSEQSALSETTEDDALRISIPDVTNKTLPEAVQELENCGFTNISPVTNDPNRSRDSWIIVSQNVSAGEAIDINTEITLECISLDEYFNNEYKGKNAAEVLSLAADAGFSVKFTDSSGTDRTDRITNAEDDEKADWVVIEASRDSGRTASVVVEFTGATPEPTEAPTPEPTATPTPEPTEEPTEEEEPTPNPTKAPAAKRYSDSEVKKYLMQVLGQTFTDPEEYEVSIKKPQVNIAFRPKGITTTAYKASGQGSSFAQEDWDALVETAKDLSIDLSETVHNDLGRDDLIVTLYYLDDLGITKKVFLMVSDGTVYYDVVNGINLLG